MNYVRSIVDYAASLGCCTSCQEDTINQGHDANERTHLLVDPVSNSPAVRRINNDDYINEYPNSLPKRDEQTALNQIVQEFGSNIIDVAAMDTHNLEQQEYSDRQKMYNNKLSELFHNVYHPTSEPVGLLKDIPNPEAILSSTPIASDDINMMRSIVHNASTALSAIKIEHKEDLVLGFRIP